MLKGFLEILPKIADHPIAIAAYICLIGAWLLRFYRQSRSKDFLKTLESLPKSQRSEYVRKAGYKYKYDALAALPQKDRLKLLTHQYRLIAFIVTIIAVIVLAMLGFVLYQQNYRDLKVAYTELQRLSIETEAAVYQFRIRVEGARTSADTAARLTSNFELKVLGEKLRQAAEEFDAKYHSQQTPEMVLQVRVARARVAIAEGHFKEAEDLVADEEVGAQMSVVIRMLLVRADAAFGQRQWSTAKKYFQKILGMDPTHTVGLLGASSCALELRQFEEVVSISDRLVALSMPAVSKDKAMMASALYNRAVAYKLLEQSTNSINDCSQIVKILFQLRDEQVSNSPSQRSSVSTQPNIGKTSFQIPSGLGAFLARVLSLRSSVFIDLGRFQDAILDSSQAVELFASLRKGGRHDLALELADALDRLGNSYVNVGLISNGVTNFSRALQILETSIDSSTNYPFVLVAGVLTDRGLAYVYLHQSSNGIADCDHAIQLWDSMIKSNRYELKECKAITLNTRGLAYYFAGQMTNTIMDCNTAIDILKPLIEGGRSDLKNSLAGAYSNRGMAYTALGQAPRAISDYDRAIEIRAPLAKNGPSEFANGLARVLDNRGLAFQVLRLPDRAILDHTAAIDIWEPLSNGDRPDVVYDLAKALGNRGDACLHLGQITNAIADHRRSTTILLDLVDGKRMTHLDADLARELLAFGALLAMDGKTTEAKPFLDRAISLDAIPAVTEKAKFFRDNVFSR